MKFDEVPFVPCNDCTTYESCTQEAYEQGRADGRKEAFDEIDRAMYHECFEVSHEEDGLQKWDSGNWFRYKLFENVIERLEEKKDG